MTKARWTVFGLLFALIGLALVFQGVAAVGDDDVISYRFTISWDGHSALMLPGADLKLIQHVRTSNWLLGKPTFGTVTVAQVRIEEVHGQDDTLHSADVTVNVSRKQAARIREANAEGHLRATIAVTLDGQELVPLPPLEELHQFLTPPDKGP